MDPIPAPMPQPSKRRRVARVVLNVFRSIDRDHLPIASAGVAFFLLLGIFPGLAALFSVYSWLADPSEIERQLQQESGVLPHEVHLILLNQVKLACTGKTASWGAFLGLLFAFWAGSRAIKGLIQGLNIVFHQSEKRGFLSLQIASIVLTFTLIMVIAAALSLIAIIPALIAMLPGDKYTLGLFTLLRWPVLLTIIMFLLAVLYRFGPSNRDPKWKWISPGAVSATFFWLVTSALFSYYVDHFGFYLNTYSSLGTIAIFMLWLYLTAFFILLGAEIDEAIRQDGEGRQN
jgi:membrane protein